MEIYDCGIKSQIKILKQDAQAQNFNAMQSIFVLNMRLLEAPHNISMFHVKGGGVRVPITSTFPLRFRLRNTQHVNPP